MRVAVVTDNTDENSRHVVVIKAAVAMRRKYSSGTQSPAPPRE